MIGPLIGIITNQIAKEVMERLVNSPRIPVNAENAHVAEPVVERAVEHALRDSNAVQHLTNNEPWYKSNVTWGAIFAILGGTATIGTHFVMGQPLSWEAYGTPLLAIWGGCQAIYGRWLKRVPLS